MKKEKPFPVLYVFVRNDLKSMSIGKAAAHSGHAASQFVYRYMRHDERNALFDDWIKSGDGFGTQINLSGGMDDMAAVKQAAESVGIDFGLVIDPTYPFVPPKHISSAFLKPVMLREEVTALWVFGDKNSLDMKRIVSGFSLA